MRKPLLPVGVLVGAFVLIFLGITLRARVPAAESVSIGIDGYTNYLGGHFAGAVITNRGAAPIRIWGWASFQGSSPSQLQSRHEPSEHTRLLPPGGSWRVLIPAPTDGTPWCAEFEVSHDSWYIRLIQRLRSPRYEWIKTIIGLSEPEVSVEVVHTESHTR